jgi:hypothetical protein
VTATLTLPEGLRKLSPEQAEELACKAHLGVWTARKRLLEMAPVHWEWCELAMSESRLALVAPREHSKTETFTVNATAWRSEHSPGLWTSIFSQTMDQAKIVLKRVQSAIEETAPWLLDPKGGYEFNSTRMQLTNGALVTVAGAGKSVRGIHPDIIIGDDVLEEQDCLSELQRKRMERWWKGTVGGMAHPGTIRRVRQIPGDLTSPFITVRMPPTKVFLVGTPFHDLDLLMGMKKNPMYRYRRYAAEFEPGNLVAGTLAVEAT